MSIYKSKKASEGQFSGCLNVSIPEETHRTLYKEATSKNLSLAQLVRSILEHRSYISKRCIWTSDEYIKRNSYTVIFFKNNMNTDEVCVHLHGVFQADEDLNDMDHKFSNFIVNHLEFKEQKMLSCEFFEDDSGEKQLKLSSWEKL